MLWVAMNPAALITNLVDLVKGGIWSSTRMPSMKKGMKQAGYEESPLEDGSLSGYQVFPVEVTRLTRLRGRGTGPGHEEADRCRNFYAMGLGPSGSTTARSTRRCVISKAKFGKRRRSPKRTRRALKAGYNYGETTEAFASHFRVSKAKLQPGCLSKHHGERGHRLGPDCGRAAEQNRVVPRQLSDHPGKRHSARAVAAQELWRAYVPGRKMRSRPSPLRSARALAEHWPLTTSSGPGIALKQEAIGPGRDDGTAAGNRERPTRRSEHGLPTKTEQADLLQAVCGRNGELPGAGRCRSQPRRLL